MFGDKNYIQHFHENVASRMFQEKEELDIQNGCIYCFKLRQQGSLYCSEKCKEAYEFHNAQFLNTIALLTCAWCETEQVIRNLEPNKNKIHICIECRSLNLIIPFKDTFRMKKMNIVGGGK